MKKDAFTYVKASFFVDENKVKITKKYHFIFVWYSKILKGSVLKKVIYFTNCCLSDDMSSLVAHLGCFIMQYIF